MQKLFCPKHEGTDKIFLIQFRRVKKFLNQSIKTENVKPDTFLFFNDSSMLAFKAADAAKCTNDSVAGVKLCVGVIDVNGTKGPNKVVACDTANATDATCTVSNPTDIYPVTFYDQTILPASPAAKAVLYGK